MYLRNLALCCCLQTIPTGVLFAASAISSTSPAASSASATVAISTSNPTALNVTAKSPADKSVSTHDTTLNPNLNSLEKAQLSVQVIENLHDCIMQLATAVDTQLNTYPAKLDRAAVLMQPTSLVTPVSSMLSLLRYDYIKNNMQSVLEINAFVVKLKQQLNSTNPNFYEFVVSLLPILTKWQSLLTDPTNNAYKVLATAQATSQSLRLEQIPQLTNVIKNINTKL